MTRILSAGIVAITLASCAQTLPSDAFAASVACVSPPPIGSSYKLVFDDEFNGVALDISKWSTGWFGSGITQPVNNSIEQACYDPAQVTVSNGSLDLTAITKKQTCGGKVRPLRSPHFIQPRICH